MCMYVQQQQKKNGKTDVNERKYLRKNFPESRVDGSFICATVYDLRDDGYKTGPDIIRPIPEIDISCVDLKLKLGGELGRFNPGRSKTAKLSPATP